MPAAPPLTFLPPHLDRRVLSLSRLLLPLGLQYSWCTPIWGAIEALRRQLERNADLTPPADRSQKRFAVAPRLADCRQDRRGAVAALTADLQTALEGLIVPSA